MIERLKSTKAAVKMPELSKTLIHDDGVALVEAWIKSLPGACQE